MATVGRGGTR